MRLVTTSLLDVLLGLMSKLPGRRALLLVPAAALYGRIDPEFFRARADSISDASGASHTKASTASSQPAVPTTDAPATGLTALLSKLMGPNEFASVSATSCAAAASSSSSVNPPTHSPT